MLVFIRNVFTKKFIFICSAYQSKISFIEVFANTWSANCFWLILCRTLSVILISLLCFSMKKSFPILLCFVLCYFFGFLYCFVLLGFGFWCGFGVVFCFVFVFWFYMLIVCWFVGLWVCWSVGLGPSVGWLVRRFPNPSVVGVMCNIEVIHPEHQFPREAQIPLTCNQGS